MRRSRPCVSGWIKIGKISAAALIGDGREAKIWVERAEADLAASLDPSQQAAQASPILGSSATPTPMNDLERRIGAAPANGGSNLSERERDLARRAKADADKAECDAEAARRKLALDQGRYVLAEEAATAWAREMSKCIGEIDLFIGKTLPQLTAERHNIDWKTLAAQMREDWRDFRMRMSDNAKLQREAIEQETRDA